MVLEVRIVAGVGCRTAQRGGLPPNLEVPVPATVVLDLGGRAFDLFWQGEEAGSATTTTTMQAFVPPFTSLSLLFVTGLWRQWWFLLIRCTALLLVVIVISLSNNEVRLIQDGNESTMFSVPNRQ